MVHIYCRHAFWWICHMHNGHRAAWWHSYFQVSWTCVSANQKSISEGWKLGRTTSLVCCSYGRLQSSLGFTKILRQEQNPPRRCLLWVFSCFASSRLSEPLSALLVGMCHEDWPMWAHKQASSLNRSWQSITSLIEPYVLFWSYRRGKRKYLDLQHTELVIFHQMDTASPHSFLAYASN